MKMHGLMVRQVLPATWVEELARIAPVVVAGLFDMYQGVCNVSHNERRAAAAVAMHLAHMGHRSIAWVDKPPIVGYVAGRHVRGFRQQRVNLSRRDALLRL
jgi:DNA-binding LacI/PurR family transcriptional regulator